MKELKFNSNNDFSSKLDSTGEDIRRMGTEAVELITEYYQSIKNLPIYPDTAVQELRDNLDPGLPEDGEDFSRLIEAFGVTSFR